MTALGKVLVFFVLLFSVITGGMMAMAFVTRTNWRMGFENAQNEMKALEAAQKAERERFKAAREKYEKDIEDLKKAQETSNTQILGLRAEADNNLKKANDFEKRAKQEEANNRAATNQIAALSNERNQMKEQITEANTRNLKIEKDMVTARNNETQAIIQANKLSDQNQQLRKENETFRTQLADLKSRGFEPRNGAKAPPVEVRGTVTAVDGSIATTSLGKDHGVNTGDELQVFRLSPEPKYLGKLRVSIARDHDSVGTFTPAGRNMNISKGDTVDTKVLRGGN
jgi:hypothetical protein